VIKVESLASLRSLRDYLKGSCTKAWLRKFIPHKSQARLVVLGDQVVASDRATRHISYDFRTNISDDKTRTWEPYVYSPEVQAIAVQATTTRNLEFGGVDILFEEGTDTPYVAEVNFPCDFAGTQDKTGIDIADAMLKYLMKKSLSQEAGE
jgi:glutathione synthase/RimK-type ligase-like ATP-grasp enzyme